MYFNAVWTVPPPQESLTKTRSWKRSEHKNKGDNVYSALLNPPPTFHHSAVMKHQTRSFAAAFQLVWMLNGSPAGPMSSNLGQRLEPIGLQTQRNIQHWSLMMFSCLCIIYSSESQQGLSSARPAPLSSDGRTLCVCSCQAITLIDSPVLGAIWDLDLRRRICRMKPSWLSSAVQRRCVY